MRCVPSLLLSVWISISGAPGLVLIYLDEMAANIEVTPSAGLIRAADLCAATFGLLADDQSSRTDCRTERKRSLQNQRGSQYFLVPIWKSEPSLARCSRCSMCSPRTLSDPAVLRQISALSAWQSEYLTRLASNFSNNPTHSSLH